jgi:hypothetical protein
VSYDLLLLRLEPGEDPDAALERLEGDGEGAPDEAGLQRARDAAAAAQERFPGLDRHDDEAAVELTSLDEAKPYQVSLFADQGGANIPYWHDDERARETYDEVFGILEVVCERTGWSIYDPQLGRLVTTADLPEILGMHGRGVDAVRRIAAEEPPQPPPAQKRGFLRRILGG